MITVKDLLKDDKKSISYYFFTVDQYHMIKNCVTKIIINKIIEKRKFSFFDVKSFLASSCFY